MPNLNVKKISFEQAFSRYVQELMHFTRDVMEHEAPSRTGRLRRSIQASIKIGKEYAEIVVGPTVSYAMFVEFGTRPHIIRPVYARYLRFEVAGRIVFAREVHHPGTRPNPFVRRTAEIIRQKLKEGMKLEVSA